MSITRLYNFLFAGVSDVHCPESGPGLCCQILKIFQSPIRELYINLEYKWYKNLQNFSTKKLIRFGTEQLICHETEVKKCTNFRQILICQVFNIITNKMYE